MSAEESGIMVSAVETITTLGLELLDAWMFPAENGGKRGLQGVLCEDKPGDGRESEAGN